MYIVEKFGAAKLWQSVICQSKIYYLMIGSNPFPNLFLTKSLPNIPVSYVYGISEDGLITLILGFVCHTSEVSSSPDWSGWPHRGISYEKDALQLL